MPKQGVIITLRDHIKQYHRGIRVRRRWPNQTLEWYRLSVTAYVPRDETLHSFLAGMRDQDRGHK